MGSFTVLAFVAVRNLRRCGWGRSLHVIEEGQDTLLRHVGVNTTRAEVLLFAISGAIAGLAGATYALIVNLFGAFEFIPLYSIAALLAAVVGGLGSLWGPVIAGVLFGYGPYLAEKVSVDAANAYPQIASSILALVLIVRCPQGLASLFTWGRQTMARSSAGARADRFRGQPVALDGAGKGRRPSPNHRANGRRPLRRPEPTRLRRSSPAAGRTLRPPGSGRFRGLTVELDRTPAPRTAGGRAAGSGRLRRPEPVGLRRPTQESET
jgi:MFS family permease